MSKMQKRHGVGFCILGILMLLFTVLYRSAAPSERETISYRNETQDIAKASEAYTTVSETVDKHSVSMVHKVTSESEDQNHRTPATAATSDYSYLYEPSQIGSDGRYVHEESTIDTRGACADTDHTVLGSASNMISTAGLNGYDWRPQAGRIVNQNQHFVTEHGYAQLIILRHYSSPDLYQVSLRQYPTLDIEAPIEGVSIDGYDGRPVDIDTAFRLAEQVRFEMRSQGAKEGKRSLVVTSIEPQPDGKAYEMAFVDGRITRFDNGETRCIGYEMLECFCKEHFDDHRDHN